MGDEGCMGVIEMGIVRGVGSGSVSSTVPPAGGDSGVVRRGVDLVCGKLKGSGV